MFRSAASAFASANPSTFAALVGGGLVAAAQTLADSTGIGTPELAAACSTALEQVRERGGAEVGDKTMVDVLVPVVQVLETHQDQLASAVAGQAVVSAEEAVREGTDRTLQAWPCRLGRRAQRWSPGPGVGRAAAPDGGGRPRALIPCAFAPMPPYRRPPCDPRRVT